MNTIKNILHTFLVTSLLLTPLLSTYAKQERLNANLVVIQNVANDDQSFVIRKGMADNITKGQISLFSSNSISFTARAISITNEYSQWIVNDKNMKVPFEKGQIVTMNYSPERVWLEIPKIMGDKNYQEMLAKEEAAIQERQFVRYDNRFEIFYGKYQGLSESTALSENNDASRVGDSFQFNYAIPFNQTFQFIAGFRYDNDLVTLLNPAVEQETTRYMATASLKILFNNKWNYRFSYFVLLGAGYGRSETTLQDTVKVGSAMLLPSVGLGLEYKISTTKSLIFKVNFDAIHSNEAFADSADITSDMTALGLSVGYAF